ncbi:MAG: hypothetical protein FJ206_08700 [Gemmatimonadetes bacterium]|nr:hypothetical protein [Gemmatimonadota bacterium]
MSRIKRDVIVCAALLLTGGALIPARAQDSAEFVGPRAERLRQLIEERFAERLTVELGLNPDQATRVRSVLFTWAQKRRQLEREERGLRQRLGSVMRPGVAADERQVTKLTDEILDSRLAYVQTFKDELTALADVLTPVQRGQYILMRDRLMQRVQEIRSQRPGQFPLRDRRP